MDLVEALCFGLGEPDHLERADGEAGLLDAASDFADKVFADAVGFDDGEGAFDSHVCS